MAGETDATANRLDALKRSFHYAPVAAPEEKTQSDGEVVTLEKLTVVESMKRRQMTATIEDRWRRDAADRFDWSKGGSLYTRRAGAGQMDLGFWPQLESPVLGEAVPIGAVRLKLTLLKLKW